jgi:hypothetical protein
MSFAVLLAMSALIGGAVAYVFWLLYRADARRPRGSLLRWLASRETAIAFVFAWYSAASTYRVLRGDPLAEWIHHVGLVLLVIMKLTGIALLWRLFRTHNGRHDDSDVG